VENFENFTKARCEIPHEQFFAQTRTDTTHLDQHPQSRRIAIGNPREIYDNAPGRELLGVSRQLVAYRKAIADHERIGQCHDKSLGLAVPIDFHGGKLGASTTSLRSVPTMATAVSVFMILRW